MASNEQEEGIPIFVIKTIDRISGRTLLINFKRVKRMEAFVKDFDEAELARAWITDENDDDVKFRIPMEVSPVFWSKPVENEVRNYVVDVLINDKFAIRRVLTSRLIRDYLITSAIMAIQKKFNHPEHSKEYGQHLGHQLELPLIGYGIIESQNMERTDQLVVNKIVPVAGTSGHTERLRVVVGISANYDLHYRPKSKLLTCVIPTDKLPDSISFNSDRIVVRVGENSLLDAHLPFYVDLEYPVKYRYNDKGCLFRVVLKVTEDEIKSDPSK